MDQTAIRTEGLVHHFGDVEALAGIDLVVARGTVFGLLGPNGAGKTTFVCILTTLLRPTGGRVEVSGHDVRENPAAVRSRLGLTGQYAAVDGDLTGRENLALVGRLLGQSRAEARRNAGDLLERFALTDAADRRAGGYSGGMRRRLDLAASLIGRPEIVVLDEPTTGLDPQSRLALWDVIREVVADGATVVLTTQYLEEADHLADDIVVIDKGRVIAAGTPTQLKDQAGRASVVLTLTHAADLPRAAELVRSCAPEVHVEDSARRITAQADGLADMTRIGGAIAASGIPVDDLGLKRPSLDDVFLHLTGHRAEPGQRDAEESGDQGGSDGPGPSDRTPAEVAR